MQGWGRTHECVHTASVSLRAVKLGSGHRAEGRLGFEEDTQGSGDLFDLLLVRYFAPFRVQNEKPVVEALVVPIHGRFPNIQG